MNSIKLVITAVNELLTFAEKIKIMEILMRLGVVDSFTISNEHKATVSSWQTKYNWFQANPQLSEGETL